MARIRTVKPELFGHEELFDAERETGLPLRLAFIGMFTCCDREGRFKWRPRTLKKDVMPHDEIDFARVLDALATRGFIRKYAFDTEEYGVIPSWSKHQVINNRESASDIPEPTESSYISMTSTRARRVDDAFVTEVQVRKEEGKGREGKGKEEEEEGKRTENTIVERRVAPPDHDPVPEIFAYWQKTMGHPGAKLDKKRVAKIRAGLDLGYTPRQLCEAVKGCSRSPHHMGQNDRNTKYNTVDLIFRSADYIDKFIELANQQVIGAETLEQKNARIIAEFLADGPVQDDPNVIDMEDN